MNKKSILFLSLYFLTVFSLFGVVFFIQNKQSTAGVENFTKETTMADFAFFTDTLASRFSLECKSITNYKDPLFLDASFISLTQRAHK